MNRARTERRRRNRRTLLILRPKNRSISAYNLAMVLPSRDRLTELARQIVDALARSRAVVLHKEREAVRQAVAQALADELRREEERQESARRRIAAMRPAPKPRSREWEELFQKFVEEEYLREGL